MSPDLQHTDPALLVAAAVIAWAVYFAVVAVGARRRRVAAAKNSRSDSPTLRARRLPQRHEGTEHTRSEPSPLPSLINH